MSKRLSTALLSDALDALGYEKQVLAPGIRPLDDATVMLGYARTGLYRQVFQRPTSGNPYEMEMRLVDDLKPGEVLVLACPGLGRLAPWGELLTTAAIGRGAVGCLTDGMVRDVRQVRTLGFPVFHGGIGPLDVQGRGEVAEMDVAVECAGVRITPGDIIFGDVDGVIVVPAAIAEKAIAGVLKKSEKETDARKELLQGASLKDVYERYKVL
ncbi:MAG TPA: RraA family protein [Bauldia sp.]|nr:RraA family protein [Bauldia sp.]